MTAASAARLDLRPGAHVTAVWKATVTRLIADQPAGPKRSVQIRSGP
ncbi:MAG: hypothetical protein JSS68_16050 [Actinobacteria bacterium]|nr:hypothetical protein [Actinomycetota bacterium]